jgi:hypothetical protein
MPRRHLMKPKITARIVCGFGKGQITNEMRRKFVSINFLH